jgi:methionyl aminopeptidase
VKKRNKSGKKRGLRRGRRAGPLRLKPDEVEKMRAAGRLAAELLDDIAGFIEPGVTTGAIDRRVAERTEAAGAVSAPLGYRGFPRHCCTSVNDVVCHGIPDDDRELKDGDIINVDVTPILDSFHGDSSRTFLVGEPSPVAKRLVNATYRSLWLGIQAVKPGGRTGDIGHAIQAFAETQGYSVVREFTGHGIHTVFHTAPTIFHYGSPGQGEELLPGMSFTIEPMINLGHWKTEVLDDGWTAVTQDGTLSAQFEHTVVVGEDSVEVLTLGELETPPV